MPSKTIAAIAAAASLLAGCSFNVITDRITPYRIDIRQGNYVDQDMVSKLKKGMTREQVRFALGTPLVVDAIHADRWDYVYAFRPGKGEAQQRTLSVFFVNDRLDRVEGDVRAGEGGQSASGAPGERARVIEIAPASTK